MIKYLLMAVLLTVSCVSSERKEARVLYEKAGLEFITKKSWINNRLLSTVRSHLFWI